MILNLVFYISLLFGSPNTPVELDCDRFKEGTFQDFDANKKIRPIIVVREDSKQVEYNTEHQRTHELRFTWTGSCSYYLELIPNSENMDSPYLGKKLFVKILKVEGDMYKYTANFKDSKKSDAAIGWLKKIK